MRKARVGTAPPGPAGAQSPQCAHQDGGRPGGPRAPAATGTLAGSVHASFGLSPVCACGPGPQGDCGHWHSDRPSASFGLEL
jgi:hypothetical protein